MKKEKCIFTHVNQNKKIIKTVTFNTVDLGIKKKTTAQNTRKLLKAPVIRKKNIYIPTKKQIPPN